MWIPALGCKLNNSRDFNSFLVFFDWHRIVTQYVFSEFTFYELDLKECGKVDQKNRMMSIFLCPFVDEQTDTEVN